MNPRQARERYGERLQIITFQSDGVTRHALVYKPSWLRKVGEGTWLAIHVYDSTSFLDFEPRLGMFHPNALIEVAEKFGAFCVCLLPLGWGLFGLIKGYHAHGTPLEVRRLPDDTRAVDNLMYELSKIYGVGRHGVIGFADGGVFAQILASNSVLRDHIDFVVGVNSTIWDGEGQDAPFFLPYAPPGQSACFLVGYANARIRRDGKRAKSFLGWLGEVLVAKMPRVCGPLMQFARYLQANRANPGLDCQTTEDERGWVIRKTCKGKMGNGKKFVLRQITDQNLTHMWPGRRTGLADSESPFSSLNLHDDQGRQPISTLDANAEILDFLAEIYDTP